MTIESLAVFCGSRTGKNPAFVLAARELGKILAERNISLIYGGGNVGLMNVIANEVLTHKGKVIGVIPEILTTWERQHTGLTELYITPDMHARKKKMYDMCDAAVILPGGHGTLDELFEMVTWNQLSIHNKKNYILNTAGFYDHLLAHINKMKEEGFLYEELVDRLQTIATPQDLLPYL